MSHIDWNSLYLTCFVIGLLLSVLSVMTGAMHLHVGHWHIGHGHAHGAGHRHGLSPVNAFTITGFLCWFGGAGYLMHRAHTFGPAIVLTLAMLSGLAGAGLLLWFLTGVLMKAERTLEAADTEIVGVLGKLSQPIREGGVGEMLYAQNGSRRSVAVRALDGHAIDRGAEVVVMSFARGVAQVRRWSEFEDGLMGGEVQGVEGRG
ncbi:MAG: hypothetical protein PW792_13215 [Acidobacteriaceae bacterium]|nr:hypothetical protein [Acidobacteriaceae bacterium]